MVNVTKAMGMSKGRPVAYVIEKKSIERKCAHEIDESNRGPTSIRSRSYWITTLSLDREVMAG
jgi:hypothetical protein